MLLLLSGGMIGSLLLFSCGEKEETKSPAEGTPTAAQSNTSNPAIEGVFLTGKPDDAVPVLELRKTAKAGDDVVVAGKIGGAMNPFTEGFASFILADRSLRTCDLIPEDECPTPWDACCASPEEIKAARISVQIPDGNNGTVASGLRAVQGLSELDELIITGTVAEGSSEENMIVNATGIFLEKNWVAPEPNGRKEG